MKFDLMMMVLYEKVRGSTKLLHIIIWERLIFIPNFMSIHPLTDITIHRKISLITPQLFHCPTYKHLKGEISNDHYILPVFISVVYVMNLFSLDSTCQQLLLYYYFSNLAHSRNPFVPSRRTSP